MGHATHFLQRLDRVSDRQVELALALYRDDDLLKSVLSSIALPDGCERLAVSLDDPTEGPFVVLTRAGRFVTCLGAGMRARDLPVVTRERFDIAAARVQRMRDEMQRIRQLHEAGLDGQVARILKNLQQAGPRFCREDAQIVARVQPILAHDFATLLVRLGRDVRRDARGIAVLRFDRLSPAERDYVEMFGCMVWATAHLVPFIGTAEARALLGARLGDQLGSAEAANAHLAFDWGTMTHAHRALWTVARSGKDGLQYVRKLCKHGTAMPTRLFRELSLGAFAVFSSKLRGEARKALSPAPVAPVSAESSYEQLMDRSTSLLGHIVEECVLAVPDALHAGQLECARKYVAGVLGREESAEAAADIPEDIAMAAIANLPASWIGPDFLMRGFTLASSLPWLTRAPVEQLFLPRAWLGALTVAPSLREVESWFTPYKSIRTAGRPVTRVRAAPKVGRNEPCACGSGRKSKYCCALALVAG
jgi:hypothetical protein